MGGKNDLRGCSGWNLLEIVDDNAASCVYIIKKHTFKSFVTHVRKLKKLNFDKTLPNSAVNLLSFHLNSPN